MGLLNGANNIGSALGSAVSGAANALGQSLSSQSYSPSDFQANGFVVPPIPSASGTGLPSSQIPALELGNTTRNLMHWFVPEIGVINMYINPQSISYSLKKLITPERTKGGYVIQYWGEELTTLSIRGHTGGAGVEGLNVLYEIYRAEQLIFDPIALTMASDNSVSGLGDLIDNTLGNLGGLGSTLSSVTQGVLGLSPNSQSILPNNIPSLASIAFGIEMYYNGWVFRGFFTSFNFTESSERLGLFDYDIGFTVTQRRGYRTNALSWQRSAVSGASNNGPGGVPLSFSGLVGSFPSAISGANQ